MKLEQPLSVAAILGAGPLPLTLLAQRMGGNGPSAEAWQRAILGEGRQSVNRRSRRDEFLNLSLGQKRINQSLDDSLVFVAERLQLLKLSQ